MVRNDKVHHCVQAAVADRRLGRAGVALCDSNKADRLTRSIRQTLNGKSTTERRTHTAVGRANELYLDSVLSALGSEALVKAAGLSVSQQTRSKVHVQALSRPGIHPVGVVHITNGLVSTCLFAKVQRADYSGAQNLEREVRFLSDVAPLIAAENPALRSPNLIAYYPAWGLLLMEFVPGHSLKHHLFGITLSINRTNRRILVELLQCAGRWLGSLHRLTLRQGACGNPLEWLLQKFDSRQTMEAFSLYSLTDKYDEMVSILRRCVDRKPQFRRNLCSVHGEFTPIHVMIVGETIYVVDFGNSKLGYVYEDVGLFTSFYDCLLPWRSAAGSFRIRLDLQKELFLRGYFEQSPAAFNEADRAIMRWVRLISSARMLNGRQRKDANWGKRAYSWLALGTLRERFTTLCDAELEGLREMRLDIFDEGPCGVQGSRCAPCEGSAGITHLASG